MKFINCFSLPLSNGFYAMSATVELTIGDFLTDITVSNGHYYEDGDYNRPTDVFCYDETCPLSDFLASNRDDEDCFLTALSYLQIAGCNITDKGLKYLVAKLDRALDELNNGEQGND